MYHRDTYTGVHDKLRHTPKPLTPANATDYVRSKLGPHLHIGLARHAKERMADRDIIMGDINHVLKFGYIYEEGEQSSQEGLFKYKIEGSTPSSGGRNIRVVLIPYPSNLIKILTVMWVDELR
jgi:hypothetical protein